MKQTLALIILTALWNGVLAATSSAAILFSNLLQSDDDAAGMSMTTHIHASDFLTGSNPSQVTGLTASIFNGDSFSHSIPAYLYSDSGSGSPGTLLATFNPIDNLVSSLSGELVTYNHPGINLTANTMYWIAIGLGENATSASIAWGETLSNATDAGIFTNSTPPNRYTSIDGGSSWLLGPGRNGLYQLQGTVVPEPGSWFAGLMTSVILLIWRRPTNRTVSSTRS